MLKVIAQRGDEDFLVQVTEGDDGMLNGTSQVVSLDTGEVFPPFNTHSILARGYWEEVEDKDRANEALRLVRASR